MSLPRTKKEQKVKKKIPQKETRIRGVEPRAVEGAVTPREVRVNDVTATPYPIVNRVWFRVLWNADAPSRYISRALLLS